MINDFENKFHIKLKEGYNEDVVAYRLTLDPLLAYHRPLAFYVLVLFLTNIFGFVCQFLWGMKRFGPENRSTIWSLMDPQQSPYPSSHIGPEKVPYWFRDGNRRKKPIVFIHGIGGGLMCYITLVAKLVTLDAPIFFIELPFVAMNCVEEVPTAQETVRDIQQMLQRHGCTDAVFVGHSLGTSVISWAIKYIPKSVASTVFIDPICFMLHYNDICLNFVYRTPKTAAECVVKYFASSELYISYYISRHFHWYQIILFVASHHRHASNCSVTMPENTKVYLSEKDNIVNSLRVNDYLNRQGIDSAVMKGLDHASFLFHSTWKNEILMTINKYTSI